MRRLLAFLGADDDAAKKGGKCESRRIYIDLGENVLISTSWKIQEFASRVKYLVTGCLRKKILLCIACKNVKPKQWNSLVFPSLPPKRLKKLGHACD